MVDLKEKLEVMPEIKVKRRIIKSKKTQKEFLVQEIIITTYTSLDYIDSIKNKQKQQVTTIKKASELNFL